MGYSCGKLMEALFLIMLFCRTCKASGEHPNCSTSCGDHNIISPFRLQDSPEKCGDHRCEHPVDSLGFVDTAPCFNTSNASVSSSSSYSYVNVGSKTLWYLGLDDDCGIQLIYMTSWPALENNQNQSAWSCTDIHNMLLYGFDFSWLNSFCQDPGYDQRIILQAATSNRILKRILWNIQDYTTYIYALTLLGIP
ncbi:hypothetical protein K1719_043456 [Acacia pycnantha]|nr:hypothetical protein K1719_043456 [Acacia pycnantha]